LLGNQHKRGPSPPRSLLRKCTFIFNADNGPRHGNGGHMPGMRVGHMPLNRVGHRRQRVALAVSIKRRRIGAANHLRNLFQPPGRAAAPLNSADPARSQ
jgi:hypothetical protein